MLKAIRGVEFGLFYCGPFLKGLKIPDLLCVLIKRLARTEMGSKPPIFLLRCILTPRQWAPWGAGKMWNRRHPGMLIPVCFSPSSSVPGILKLSWYNWNLSHNLSGILTKAVQLDLWHPLSHIPGAMGQLYKEVERIPHLKDSNGKERGRRNSSSWAFAGME